MVKRSAWSSHHDVRAPDQVLTLGQKGAPTIEQHDAQATALYADAFGRDPKFAAFYRNLQAYRATFHDKSDVMVVDSSSEFFKAMRGSDAGDASAAPRKR